MEEQMKGQVCEGKTCGAGGCCFGHGGWYRVVRWILGIAIILIVFGFGVMIGELKGELGRSYGHRMMGNYGGNYGRMYPMMQNGSGYGGMTGTPSTKTAPTAPAAQSGQ
jgi:hypothetical protein